MTGTIAYDQTQPAVAARRDVLLSFTSEDLALILADHVASLLGFVPAAVGAEVKFRGDVMVEIAYSMPAATPAPLPLTFPVAAPASAPPQFLWYEFQVANTGPFGMRFAWGHGRNKSEAHADACIRHEGEPGEVTHHTCRSMIDLPVNVTPLYYEFAIDGHAVTYVGHGCTEAQGWGWVCEVFALSPDAPCRCVGVSRRAIEPAPAPVRSAA